MISSNKRRKHIEANKFQRQYQYMKSWKTMDIWCAWNIFELSICKYDHLNNTKPAILRVPLNFRNVRQLIYLHIYKFDYYINGKYIWNHSVMWTNKTCFVKRNIIVKHMTRKVYAITKNSVASTHCAFEGCSMFKVRESSMWYMDDNRWEDNNK